MLEPREIRPARCVTPFRSLAVRLLSLNSYYFRLLMPREEMTEQQWKKLRRQIRAVFPAATYVAEDKTAISLRASSASLLESTAAHMIYTLKNIGSGEKRIFNHYPTSLKRLNNTCWRRDRNLLSLFRTAATNGVILLDIFPELGEEIEPRTIQEPVFVADIARAFVAAPTEQVEGSLGPIHRGHVPEVITSIALTLHRMPAFAEIGLDLFEKLLDANLREARAATELLDRKPSRLFTPHTRRPRRPRRRRR